MKKYYEKINDIKHDIEQNLNLGFSSLLSKDQKFYKWNNKTKINTFYITNSPVEEKWRLFTIYNPIKLPFNKE